MTINALDVPKLSAHKTFDDEKQKDNIAILKCVFVSNRCKTGEQHLAPL